jgi:hypothetical protein
MTDRTHAPADGMKIVLFVTSIILFAATICSTTLAIQGSRDRTVLTVQIDKILTVMDQMKAVDAGLASQIAAVQGVSEKDIAEVRSSTAGDIALINQRIETISQLLAEIKSIVLKR